MQGLHLAPALRTNPLGGASATPLIGVAPCTDWLSPTAMKDELLTTKELAFVLKRHRNYISEMKRAGFPLGSLKSPVVLFTIPVGWPPVAEPCEGMATGGLDELPSKL